ncbi:hypothetical protein [Streptomyces sp. ME18-1-4]|uniref:hypothetical protein n=1 Tax=Streptomyces sp. ME18-1-4 TaxID=3028685 RepID=UPI0029AA0F2D|nr:hypothetical protein [Streptomyces sp. ME18-1-4]MDX3248419.1 hypothetical protein [Streptomyces sp. ME18-1-4]
MPACAVLNDAEVTPWGFAYASIGNNPYEFFATTRSYYPGRAAHRYGPSNPGRGCWPARGDRPAAPPGGQDDTHRSPTCRSAFYGRHAPLRA